jgi:hypothetical protein
MKLCRSRAILLLVVPVAVIFTFAFPAGTRARAIDCVVYELAAGSELVDECLPCGRPPGITPISGSFVLHALAVGMVGDLYSVLDIDFRPAMAGSPLVEGTGKLHRIGSESSLQLDVDIVGTHGVHLESMMAPDKGKWSEIDITAGEDGTRDPFHAYRIRIVAAPSARTILSYELQPGNLLDQSGSFLVDDCLGCERPAHLVPMQGSFLLEEVSAGPDPVSRYKVHCLDLQSASGESHYDVMGNGTYDQGGEVALQQNMMLQVSINGEPGIRMLGGGPFPEGVSFPTIDIQVGENDPPPPPVLHFYTLHIVAHPLIVDSAPFRRGDSNADGRLDISDGVFILLWRFSGGTEPPCLDAADSNGDGRNDLSDAVFVLNFLFTGGEAPPQPGPRECVFWSGALGCASYSCTP